MTDIQIAQQAAPLPIGDIAAACGFHTASYFSTLFRKHNGVSPAIFRSQGRKSVSTAS